MATKYEELLDTIGGMTVLELSEFVDAFKEKFNVTAVAAPVVMPGGAAPAGEAAAEEKEDFDVVLLGSFDTEAEKDRLIDKVMSPEYRKASFAKLIEETARVMGSLTG